MGSDKIADFFRNEKVRRRASRVCAMAILAEWAVFLGFVIRWMWMAELIRMPDLPDLEKLGSFLLVA